MTQTTNTSARMPRRGYSGRGCAAVANITPALLGGIALLGCAMPEHKAGFAEVQGLLAQRQPQPVQWRYDAQQDAAVEATVRQLLSQPLDAEAAVHVALLKSPALQAAFERLGVAAADLMQAGLLANPILGAQIRSSSVGTQREFGVTQDFLSLVTLVPRRRLAEAELQRAKLEAAQSVLDLATKVKLQYYTVAGDAQSLELMRRASAATQAAAELAQRQRAAGNLSLRDQAAQQVFYAQTLLELARLETQWASDRETLNRLMGLWGRDTQWTTAERLPEVPEELSVLASLESQAIADRFDLAAAKQGAANLASAYETTNRYRLLSVLGLGYSYERDSDGEKLKGPNLELGLPLFDRSQANLARLRAQLRQSERSVEALAVEIRSEVRDAHRRLKAQRDVALHYRKAVLPLHRTVVAETLKFYNGMLLGVYDLLTATQNQILAEREYITAVTDYWRAVTGLEAALGGGRASQAHPPSPVAPKTSQPQPASDAAHQH